MLRELLTLYKTDCDRKNKPYNVDEFVEWIYAQKGAYLRLCEESQWTPSQPGMVGFIRTRQHSEHQ